MNWKVWLYGLAHTVIGGCASAGAALIVAPETFNFHEWHKLGALVAASALTSLFSYLSKTPLPEWKFGDTDRRTPNKEGVNNE